MGDPEFLAVLREALPRLSSEHTRNRLSRFIGQLDPTSRAPWRPHAKMTPAGVREMRRRWAEGESIKALAEEFCLAYYTAYAVVHHMTWRHVRDGKPTEAKAA